MKTPEIYVSTDIEADGPIPGPHSMLSFGSAAFLGDGTLLGTHTANLATLPGASGHPVTMKWWATQLTAWDKSREQCQRPEIAMPAYATWIKSLPGKPVFVGYPASFDFMFICWYLFRFAGENPFSFAALDIKTFAMALMNCDYRQATKQSMPETWKVALPHTHVALDDALEQGQIFCNMLAERARRADQSRP
ncbi:MAG TPA: hypothetical protein P5528_15515 [Steroidobacteraceae bacterium]|nr:hypothetical protein [Steroidobacteraceae bacterium]